MRALTAAAAAAVEPVRRLTGLHAEFDPSQIRVVARPAWIAANVRGIEHSFSDALREVRDRSRRTRVVEALGSRATGAQLGLALAWMSGRVLGQFDPLGPGGSALMLVAPSISAAGSALDVPARDFRLWVCLHEETHRVQFSAVPWLGDFLIGQIRSFILTEDATSLTARISNLARGGANGGLVGMLSSPQQRRILDRLAAMMSVLEGHAEVVMDDVGPDVVPSVGLIRDRFDQRRGSPGRLDSVLRRLIGLDAKLRQYTEGAAFVRAVVAAVGMAGFNRVWQSPDHLPSADEVAEPERWVLRVCG